MKGYDILMSPEVKPTICQFEPSANCWESVLIMILQRGQYSWIVKMRVIGWQMDTTVML